MWPCCCLGTGGALPTVRPLGRKVRPLGVAPCDDFLNTPLVLTGLSYHQRCQMDSDDEVRDRATYYYNILDQQQAALNNQYILNSLQVGQTRLTRHYVQRRRFLLYFSGFGVTPSVKVGT